MAGPYMATGRLRSVFFGGWSALMVQVTYGEGTPLSRSGLPMGRHGWPLHGLLPTEPSALSFAFPPTQSLFRLLVNVYYMRIYITNSYVRKRTF